MFPEGTKALQWVFQVAVLRDAIQPIGGTMHALQCELLAPRSQAFFRATRDVRQLAPEERAQAWANANKGFARITAWMGRNGQGNEQAWVMGERVTFADLFLASWMVWVRQVEGGESWDEMMSWEGGR